MLQKAVSRQLWGWSFNQRHYISPNGKQWRVRFRSMLLQKIHSKSFRTSANSDSILFRMVHTFHEMSHTSEQFVNVYHSHTGVSRWFALRIRKWLKCSTAEHQANAGLAQVAPQKALIAISFRGSFESHFRSEPSGTPWPRARCKNSSRHLIKPTTEVSHFCAATWPVLTSEFDAFNQSHEVHAPRRQRQHRKWRSLAIPVLTPCKGPGSPVLTTSQQGLRVVIRIGVKLGMIHAQHNLSEQTCQRASKTWSWSIGWFSRLHPLKHLNLN